MRATQRNVKRWRDGEMRLRRTAAGMLEAERQFRRVRAHRELPMLLAALRREVNPTEEAATSAQAESHTGPPPKFNSGRDILGPAGVALLGVSPI